MIPVTPDHDLKESVGRQDAKELNTSASFWCSRTGILGERSFRMTTAEWSDTDF